MANTRYTFLYRSADGHLMRPESFLNINKGRTLSKSQLRMLGITKVKLKEYGRKRKRSSAQGRKDSSLTKDSGCGIK